MKIETKYEIGDIVYHIKQIQNDRSESFYRIERDIIYSINVNKENITYFLSHYTIGEVEESKIFDSQDKAIDNILPFLTQHLK